MKKSLPNFITLLNLLSGVFSIFFAFNGYLDWAGYFIFFAAFFDFIDGFVARLLKVSSEIGKELDSLSDLVSFGVAPGFIIFEVLLKVTGTTTLSGLPAGNLILLFIPFLIPLFGAYRLARFNVKQAKEKGFTGLPIPANGIFYAGVGILFASQMGDEPFTPLIMTILIDSNLLLFGFLMVSGIKMISLKLSSYSISAAFFQYLLIFFSLMMLVTVGWIAIPLIIYFYIVLSIVKNLFFVKE